MGDDHDGGAPAAAAVRLPPEPASAGRARGLVDDAVRHLGLTELAEDAATCASELVANAVLHAATDVEVTVHRRGSGVRVAVSDDSPVPVVTAGPAAIDAMTGRGLRLVGSLADTWGVDATGAGKTVWAELGTGAPGPDGEPPLPPAAVPAPEPPRPVPGDPDHRAVRLVGVPVRLAMASDAHLDDLVRELQLVRSADSAQAPLALLDAVDEATHHLAGPRAVARAAVQQAAMTGRRLVDISLAVPPQAVPELWRLSAVLDQLTQLCRDETLLSPPPGEELSAFRRWFAAEVERQVGGAPPTPCPFAVNDDPTAAKVPTSELLVTERSAREAAERAAARLTSLQSVAAGLTGALGTSQVAEVVLHRGIGELGARSASLCLLQPDGETVAIVQEVGYSDAVREHWATFPVSADLPASDAIRTGQPVFLRSLADRDHLYPALTGVPATDAAFAIVPLAAEPGRVLGALAVGFPAPRDFSGDDQEFLEALAGLTAQALERARLHDAEAAARARFAYLAAASDLLNASLDLDGTLRALTDLAVPRLADWCVVHLIEAGEVRLVAAAHVEPDKRAAADALFRRWPPIVGQSGIGTVLADGRPLLLPMVTPDLLPGMAHDAEHLASLASLGFGAAMVVPLTYGGTVVGSAALANGKGRLITSEDFTLAQDLAARAGAAVTNARLFAERTHVARALQASLLPAHLPARPGLEVAARYRAAGEGLDVGGDFYDAFEAGDRLVLSIGDVCGKGVEAATVTGAARHTIRAIALTERSPAEVVRRLNDVLFQAAHDVDPGTHDPGSTTSERRFCTVAVTTVELAGGGAAVRVAVAGHPPPYVVHTGGTVEQVRASGDLIGLFPSVEVEDVAVALAPGDALVLHTDGVTERHTGRSFFGDDGVAAALAGAPGSTAAELADRLERAAVDAVPGAPTDDLAILVLRVTG